VSKYTTVSVSVAVPQNYIFLVKNITGQVSRIWIGFAGYEPFRYPLYWVLLYIKISTLYEKRFYVNLVYVRNVHTVEVIS